MDTEYEKNNNVLEKIHISIAKYNKHYFSKKRFSGFDKKYLLFGLLIVFVVGILFLLYINFFPNTKNSSVNQVSLKQQTPKVSTTTMAITPIIVLTPQPSVTTLPKEIVKFTLANLKFRKQASSDSEIHMIIPISSRLIFDEIKIDNQDFYKLSYKGLDGYIMKKYLGDEQYFEKNYTEKYIVKVQTEIKNKTDGEVMEILSAGSNILVDHSKTEEAYIHAYSPGQKVFGWVKFQSIQNK